MKFRITSGELVKGLSTVIGAVPAKATLPILETVLFEVEDDQLTLTATDLEIFIREEVDADVEESGSVCIPAKRLLDTLRQLPDIPVHFSVDERNNVTFKTDKGTYKLVGESNEDFPETTTLTDKTTVTIDLDVLKSSIRKTAFAVSTDDLRPAMMGVYFQIGTDESRIVATDGHRLVRLIRSDITAPEELKFIVPDKALNLVQKTLEKDAVCTLTVTPGNVQFSAGGTIIISRLIDEQYPNYESVIPRDNDKVMHADKDEVLSTIKRVAVFSSSSTRQIRLQLSAHEVLIQAEDIDMSSEAKESVKCEFEGEEMTIGFNAKYLGDVLSNIVGDDVRFEFSTPNRAGIIKPAENDEGEDMLMLVMPVMLNNYA